MVKLDHDDVAQNADMVSVYDRLAAEFERKGTRYKDFDEMQAELRKHGVFIDQYRDYVGMAGMTAESAHLKPYDGVLQDDGWDNDCA